MNGCCDCTDDTFPIWTLPEPDPNAEQCSELTNTKCVIQESPLIGLGLPANSRLNVILEAIFNLGTFVQLQSDWAQESITALDSIKNKPVLFSGSYLDLTNVPSEQQQLQTDWNVTDILSSAYLKNKPEIPGLFTRLVPGTVPASGGESDTATYLREDGNWAIPPTGAISLIDTLNDVSQRGAVSNAILTYNVSKSFTDPLSLVTKEYVDALALGMSAKLPVETATIATITLSGLQVIDGFSVSDGSRVLVKNQTVESENGVYVASAGTWTRTPDTDAWDELYKSYFVVLNGSVNRGSSFVSSIPDTGTVGVTGIVYNLFSKPSDIDAGAGLSKTGISLSANVDAITIEIFQNVLRVKPNTFAPISTAHSMVTLGNPNGLSLSGQVLSLTTANTNTTGALGYTDWNTFNNKISFPGFGTTHATASYGDHVHPYEPVLGNPLANNYILSSSSTGVRSWIPALGGGTVTSVGLSLPNIFTVTVPTIISAGTLTATLASQTTKRFFAAPNSGNGIPAFRAILASDLPVLPYDNYLNWTLTYQGDESLITTQMGSGRIMKILGAEVSEITGGMVTINIPTFNLSIASESVLGGIKVGAGLSIGLTGILTGLQLGTTHTTAAYGDHTHPSVTEDEYIRFNFQTGGYEWRESNAYMVGDSQTEIQHYLEVSAKYAYTINSVHLIGAEGAGSQNWTLYKNGVAQGSAHNLVGGIAYKNDINNNIPYNITVNVGDTISISTVRYLGISGTMTIHRI